MQNSITSQNQQQAKTNYGVIYFLLKGESVVYVGKTKKQTISHRISDHRRDKDFSAFKEIRVKQELLSMKEREYIALYSPKYNKSLKYNHIEKSSNHGESKSFTLEQATAPPPERTPGLTAKGRVKFTTMLRPDLRAKLETLAASNHISAADVLETIILEYF